MVTRPNPSARLRPADLRRWDRTPWSDWLVPLVLAALWALVIARGSAGITAALSRSLVFVGGPILLVAGLHGRLGGYLHADARRLLLPLPIDPHLHFAAARARHRRGLVATAAAGLGALGLVLATDPAASSLPLEQRLGLLGDFAWLMALAALVEPAVPAASAHLGRRFSGDSPATRLQHSLGGGWTIPEAVVHLYAPALGIGLTAALAMPGQLMADRWVDGLPVGSGLMATTLTTLALAIVLRMLAPHVYARGLFGSVPWLVEATRTLAGPAVPEPAPRWLQRLRDPALRLWVLQLWRLSPLPSLRLAMLVGWGTYLVASDAPPDVIRMAVLVALCALWVVPAGVLVRQRSSRARLLAPLPVDSDTIERRGWTLVTAPVAVVAMLAILRLGGLW